MMSGPLLCSRQKGINTEGNLEIGNKLKVYFHQVRHKTPSHPSASPHLTYLTNSLTVSPLPPTDSHPSAHPLIHSSSTTDSKTFSTMPPSTPDKTTPPPPPPDHRLSVSNGQVKRQFERLSQTKHAGPDSINTRGLKASADQLCGILQHLFNHSLRLEMVPVL